MSDQEVEILLVFGSQAKVIKLDKDKMSKSEYLKEKFLEAYSGQIQLQHSVMQRWDEQWNHWVDLSCSEVGLSGIKKIRLIAKESNVTRLGNLDSETSVFFLCDMQERFKPAIKYFDQIAAVAERLLKGAYILDIPVIVTEQYPKGLLHTVPELDISKAYAVVEKTKFSMMIPEVREKLSKCVAKLKSVVLFGVEAHVCVQQTALDLLSEGIEVHIIADACSSRNQVDRFLAYNRLRKNGAIITTAETVLLQLVKDKNHPKFKEIQNIIKVLPPESGLLMQSSI